MLIKVDLSDVAFPFMGIFYPPDFVRAVFVSVTNSDQTIFDVGVSFCADFRMIIYPCGNPHKRKYQY